MLRDQGRGVDQSADLKSGLALLEMAQYCSSLLSNVKLGNKLAAVLCRQSRWRTQRQSVSEI